MPVGDARETTPTLEPAGPQDQASPPKEGASSDEAQETARVQLVSSPTTPEEQCPSAGNGTAAAEEAAASGTARVQVAPLVPPVEKLPARADERPSGRA